jgi:hypothetical protein
MQFAAYKIFLAIHEDRQLCKVCNFAIRRLVLHHLAGGSTQPRNRCDKISINHVDMPPHFEGGTSQCCTNQQQHILARLHNLLEGALAQLAVSIHAQPAYTSTALQVKQRGHGRQLALASLSLSGTAKGGSTTMQDTPVHPVTNVECPFKSGQQLHGSSYTLLQQAADMPSSWLWLAKTNQPSTNQTVLLKVRQSIRDKCRCYLIGKPTACIILS